MTTSLSIGALAAALSKAQSAFPAIPKNKTAIVPTKTGGKYEYDYADLADILDATRPALAANGLALTQPVAMNGTQVTIRTRLMHASGEWIEEELTMQAVDNRPQSLGAACTYGRRYAAGGMLGVSPDADVDGEAQETAPRSSHRPPTKAPPPVKAAPAPLDPGFDPPAMVKAPDDAGLESPTDKVLKSISKATTRGALLVLVPQIKALPSEDIAMVRAAYAARQEALP